MTTTSDNLFFTLFEQVFNEAWIPSDPGKQKGGDTGVKTEQIFDEVMKRNKLVPIEGTPEDDRILHIDRRVFTNQRDDKGNRIKAWSNVPENATCRKNCHTVEVKGRKTDNNGNSTIEILSIGGHPGWLYTNANYISFIENGEIVFIKSRPLQDFVQKAGNFRIMMVGGKATIKPNDGSAPKFVESLNDLKLPYFYERDGDGSAITKVPWSAIVSALKPTVRYQV